MNSNVLARIRRGYARMWAWALKPFGRRGYRFEGEQANHAEQAAQTEVSIGLMAAAAQEADDDHRIQAMQTELTLRARKAKLEKDRAERGLTSEELGELASIDRGLADLGPQMPAQPAGGFQRIWDAPPPPDRPQGALYRFGGVLIGLGQWLPILFIVGAVFMVTGWGSAIWNGVKIGWLERQVERLTEQRDAACTAAELSGRTRRASCRQAAQAQEQAVAAAQIARQQAAAMTAERQVRARNARIEQRRQRAVQDVLADSPDAPDWSLRDTDEPAE